MELEPQPVQPEVETKPKNFSFRTAFGEADEQNFAQLAKAKGITYSPDPQLETPDGQILEAPSKAVAIDFLVELLSLTVAEANVLLAVPEAYWEE